jgi:hypothetical protein
MRNKNCLIFTQNINFDKVAIKRKDLNIFHPLKHERLFNSVIQERIEFSLEFERNGNR